MTTEQDTADDIALLEHTRPRTIAQAKRRLAALVTQHAQDPRPVSPRAQAEVRAILQDLARLGTPIRAIPALPYDMTTDEHGAIVLSWRTNDRYLNVTVHTRAVYGVCLWDHATDPWGHYDPIASSRRALLSLVLLFILGGDIAGDPDDD